MNMHEERKEFLQNEESSLVPVQQLVFQSLDTQAGFLDLKSVGGF